MIYDDLGNVAVVYYEPIPGIHGGVFFDVRHGVALAWVNKEILNGLLAVRGGCCGSQRQVIYPANENQVSVWSEGKYP